MISLIVIIILFLFFFGFCFRFCIVVILDCCFLVMILFFKQRIWLVFSVCFASFFPILIIIIIICRFFECCKIEFFSIRFWNTCHQWLCGIAFFMMTMNHKFSFSMFVCLFICLKRLLTKSFLPLFFFDSFENHHSYLQCLFFLFQKYFESFF